MEEAAQFLEKMSRGRDAKDGIVHRDVAQTPVRTHIRNKIFRTGTRIIRRWVVVNWMPRIVVCERDWNVDGVRELSLSIQNRALVQDCLDCLHIVPFGGICFVW